ncbi:Mpp10 protein [Xylona heveae TC161]|uniref:Mpp10 protein n=1 Tax=Xylona heveae (strain CBS 132557 / TC161) TaxID=1328760 RepID=A0A165IZH5_XYLHT|nr:Mpp10 protein [Xylona heveae TC161]KZF25586.1 Mpp10 protein [Xylona heveae TC161]
MTGSSNSSNTSHTLSAEPPVPAMTDTHPSSMQALVGTLSGSPYTFLQPPKSLHTAALVLTKRYLDPLAATISDAHAQRLRDARKKRKRGDYEDVPSKPLQLNQLYLEGFEMPQVWEQARRVLDATRGEVEKTLAEIPQPNAEADRPKDLKMMKFDKDGFEMSESGEDDESSLGEEGVDWEYDGEDHSEGSQASEDEEEEASALENVDDEEGEGEEELEGSEDEEDIEASGSGSEESDDEPAEEFVEDKFGLNDGFFSIDDFNKQSEFLERQDNAGLNDGAASDEEEEVDWDADPLSTQPTSFGKKGTPKAAADEDEDEDMEDGVEEDDDDEEEGGPTFGNVDLNAPEGASDEEMEDDLDEQDHGGDNTNDIMYEDFFGPPARKASSNKKKQTRVKAKRAAEDAAAQPTPRAHGEGDDNPEEDERYMQRTMDAVRRDLFDDELSGFDNDEGASDADADALDPGDPRSRRSTHERRQAKIAEEIRRLEAANVAKREWTLAGEARAVDRPMNSLLEEDLEFERAGKPVPVITNDITEDIESMIKRRILAQQFDEVPRRRPDDLAVSSSARRGRFELEDTKPQQSLAEMYEQDHLRRTDPSYVDQRDEKLKAQHTEIENLWRDVSAKLDGLCSYHYRPKPVAPSLNIVADVAAVSMEDARPTAGNDVAAASMLAPQEIFAPGKDSAGQGEVVTKSAAPVAREEMTREEKLRRRRREKERIKKSNTNQGTGASGAAQGNGAQPQTKTQKKKADESNVLGQLKKSGVKVIGKKGELRDVEGKKVAMGGERKSTGGNFKL